MQRLTLYIIISVIVGGIAWLYYQGITLAMHASCN